jgi:hypothetical protein
METIPIAQLHSAMRRIFGPLIYIDSKMISTADHIVYPFSDVHLGSRNRCRSLELQPQGRSFRICQLGGRSSKFERFSITHEHAIQRLGKTVCLGTRLAKLELGLIAGISTRTVT